MPLIVLFLGLLLPLRAASALGAEPAESKRLVAVIVADSLDKSIGKAVAKDAERLKQTLEDGFSKDKDRLIMHPIDGDKVTPDDVLGFIEKLAVDKQDTILFFYSGHGAWDNTKGQYLQMYSGPGDKKGDLFRATLLDKLKAKNARLTVVVTNICNAEAESRAPLTRDLTRPPNFQVLRRLFLVPAGLVDLTSAQKGEYAWNRTGGPVLGGLFSICFIDLLRAELKPGQAMNWAVAHEKLQKSTQEDYSRLRENFLKAYSDADEADKEKYKGLAKIFREQDAQTVHAYTLPRP
jgi:hypothetical protein